jgi:hypothetical protein
MSGKLMNEYLEGMKDVTVLPQKVTIKGAVKKSDIENLNELADAILE